MPSEPSLILNGEPGYSQENLNNPFLHVNTKNHNKLPQINNTNKPLKQKKNVVDQI
jgi:hypothetical protein